MSPVAALLARMNEGLNGRLPFLTPRLYQIPSAANAFQDITASNNGIGSSNGYEAAPG